MMVHFFYFFGGVINTVSPSASVILGKVYRRFFEKSALPRSIVQDSDDDSMKGGKFMVISVAYTTILDFEVV